MATITVGAVIALILIGSIVRMTGSGMGCPDWPKCFGQWVPPTDVSQLPADYKARFAVAGKEIADFDAFKTWVEYLNRLFGVLVGLLGIATLVRGVQARKKDPGLMRLSVLGLLLTMVAGGVGAYVVKTNLSEGMITVHMTIALMVLSTYLWAWSRSQKGSMKQAQSGQVRSSTFWISVGVLVLVMSQILMGTQVREHVDALLKAGVERDAWIASLDGVYNVHKFSHYLVSAALIWLASRVWKMSGHGAKGFVILSMIFTGVEVILGIGMHHFAVPQVFQPLHLLFATLLFATSFLATRWLWFGMKAEEAEKEIFLHGS